MGSPPLNLELSRPFLHAGPSTEAPRHRRGRAHGPAAGLGDGGMRSEESSAAVACSSS